MEGDPPKPPSRQSQSISSRSLSLNSVSSDGSSDPPANTHVGHEDILALTQDVKAFKDALSNLRRIFHPERDKQELIRSAAHEKLGNVLRILRGILEKYAPLQSTELLMAAGQLIQQVKGFNFEDEKSDPTEFFEAIDQVALAFSSRVSEYLMGDLDTSSSVHPAVRTKSCENLADENGKHVDKFPDVLTSEQIDEALMRVEQQQGVNVALQRAKVWAKYTKDIVAYVEKRCALELEHSRNVAKLAQATRTILKEESFLPFQAVYCTALDQEADNANLMQATCSLLQGHKFIEPLIARRNEHEKVRKQLKETWQRETKKMQDAINNLRKARSVYIQRQLEYEKAKDLVQRAELSEGLDPSKIDKKKKWEEEVMQKAAEADTTYKACVIEANDKHQNLQRVKGDVLRQIRELILQCDQTMKAATVSYFQLLHTVIAPVPVQYQTLCENSRLYEPGNQYMEFVKRLEICSDVPVVEPSPFSFEPFVPTDSRLHERRTNNGLEGSEESLTGVSQSSDQGKGRKVWCPVSDSDSVGSNQSNKSIDTSPYGSPRIPIRRLDSINDELLEVDDPDSGEGQSRGFSKAAITHTFRKLKTPARCRECDTYVYFQGLDCTECGLACHKKCTEVLALQCGHKRMKPKLTTFGVDLSSHLNETRRQVPHLVTRCVEEVEKRGTHIKGIYRVSGVKSKVEKLCQSFENGVELVDLSDIHPNVIANVLKLYLRQLPEPLLTFALYPDFILLAQKYQSRANDATESKEIILELEKILMSLPKSHFACLSEIIRHLKRVSDLSEINNMPPRNLGIVFGPTLLRTSEGSASLSSLVDTVFQTRIVELLIVFSHEIFGVDLNAVLPVPKPHSIEEDKNNKMEDEKLEEMQENELSPSSSKDDDKISVRSFDVTDGEGEPPVPPPRRHPGSARSYRSSPECDEKSENSIRDSGDKIVIHVEGNRIPIVTPRTLVPSDFSRKDEVDDVPYVDESPPESQYDISMSCKKERPVPSPRYSRLMPFALTIPSASPSVENAVEVTGSSPSPILHTALQPSPLSSIPSTTSSMDELDVSGVSSASQSPIPGEYVSPYLTQDPYKNLRLSSVNPLILSRTTTFANYDEPVTLRLHHSRCRSKDADDTTLTNELGSRNSLLRTATRYQRHSPACSTASTKSSSDSSPLPDDNNLARNSRVSHSLSPPLHRVSSDSNVFVKSSLEETKTNQRPPRFV